jgi:hypothetical protein
MRADEENRLLVNDRFYPFFVRVEGEGGHWLPSNGEL